MAQSFSLRYPLVDGSGNFGSLDGDSAAAMRYTECRLARISDEMLVGDRPGHGRLPPELRRHEDRAGRAARARCRTCWSTARPASPSAWPPASRRTTSARSARRSIKLLDNPDLTSAQLCRYVKGPDFPTGGQILNSADELKEIYKTGSGADPPARHVGEGPTDARRRRRSSSRAFRTRSTSRSWSSGSPRSSSAASCRRCVDVKDVSTDDVRIELEIKRDADAKMVMAYLFKHTPLQTNFAVNLTCLIPTENPEVGRPERLDLKSILWHFLHFRLEVVTTRLEHELAALRSRIHVLEGFEKVFDALDEIIRIIRKSDGKQDAAREDHEALRPRRRADRRDPRAEDLSARAARDPRHPQGARREAEARAADRRAARATRTSRWTLVRDEIEDDPEEVRQREDRPAPHAASSRGEEVEYSADDFIVEEDNVVIVSRDGWVKRQKEVKDLATTRLREGDAVLAVLRRQHARDGGVLHELRRRLHGRIIDVPASTGYGEPIQRLFKFRDGEQVVSAVSLDPRATPGHRARRRRRRAADACAGGDERRLQPALRPRAVRRAEHARGPPLRAAGRRRRGRRRVDRRRRARRSSPPPSRRARCSARSTRSTTCRARARASS